MYDKPPFAIVDNALLESLIKKIDNLSRKFDDRDYKISEAAKRMNISKSTVYSLMNKGLLHFRCGEGGRRISEQHIQKYWKTIDSSNI